MKSAVGAVVATPGARSNLTGSGNNNHKVLSRERTILLANKGPAGEWVLLSASGIEVVEQLVHVLRSSGS